MKLNQKGYYRACEILEDYTSATPSYVIAEAEAKVSLSENAVAEAEADIQYITNTEGFCV